MGDTTAVLLPSLNLRALALGLWVLGPLLHPIFQGAQQPWDWLVVAAVAAVGLPLGAVGVRPLSRAAAVAEAVAASLFLWLLVGWSLASFAHSLPGGTSPLILRLAMGAALVGAGLTLRALGALRRARTWLVVGAILWALSWPPLHGPLFLLSPTASMALYPGLALAGLMLLSQARRAAAQLRPR